MRLVTSVCFESVIKILLRSLASNMTKHVFGFFVLMCCLTTGFGLKCYRCSTNDGEKCDEGKGPEQKCVLMDLYVKLQTVSDTLKRVNFTLEMPPMKVTIADKNAACAKAITYKDEKTGKRKIGRFCNFYMYGDVDGCELMRKLHVEIKGFAAAAKDPTAVGYLATVLERLKNEVDYPDECYLCQKHLCNATTRLTPVSLIYPSLFLLFLVMYK